MSLKYEPSSEPLHISAKWPFLHFALLLQAGPDALDDDRTFGRLVLVGKLRPVAMASNA